MEESSQQMFGIAKQIKDQYEFNKVLLKDLGYDIDNLTDRELNDILIAMVLHTLEECHEILRELNWKMHNKKNHNQIDRNRILEEVIDVNKFTMNFVVFLKVTPEEFINIWDWKTNEVLKRYLRKKELENGSIGQSKNTY